MCRKMNSDDASFIVIFLLANKVMISTIALSSSDKFLFGMHDTCREVGRVSALGTSSLHTRL